MVAQIKISVITINLNNKDGLQKTIESVINQNYDDIEYIVIDGDSSDGSKSLLSNTKINKVISEKDSGIYQAMNKGIELATGKYCLFLNSGDTFYDRGVLKHVGINMTEDLVYGDIEIMAQNSSSILKSPSELNFNTLLNEGLSHQATFIKRDLFIKYGLYNSNMKICADWIFFLDIICKYQASYRYIPLTIATFKMDGISSLASNADIVKKEKEQHLESNYSAFLDYYQSTKAILAKYEALKNSRLRKILAIFIRQLKV